MKVKINIWSRYFWYYRHVTKNLNTNNLKCNNVGNPRNVFGTSLPSFVETCCDPLIAWTPRMTFLAIGNGKVADKHEWGNCINTNRVLSRRHKSFQSKLNWIHSFSSLNLTHSRSKHTRSQHWQKIGPKSLPDTFCSLSGIVVVVVVSTAHQRKTSMVCVMGCRQSGQHRCWACRRRLRMSAQWRQRQRWRQGSSSTVLLRSWQMTHLFLSSCSFSRLSSSDFGRDVRLLPGSFADSLTSRTGLDSLAANRPVSVIGGSPCAAPCEVLVWTSSRLRP